MSRRHGIMPHFKTIHGTSILIVLTLAVAAEQLAAADNVAKLQPPRDASLVVQLVRDPTVQAELDLTSGQKQAVARLVAEVEYPLFLLRDAGPADKPADRESLAMQVETGLRNALEQPARKRLAEILLRAQGYPALLGPPHADTLALTKTQITDIRGVLAATQKAKPGTPAASADKQVLGILTNEQNDQLTRLIGSSFDLSQVRTVACRAPELRDVERWINTDPLSFAALQGRVVAVHFWAFGCVNCLRNLPHYKDWHERYADKGLTVLGLHTPETETERSLDNLAEQVKSRAIAYPVGADAKSANWAAWANHLWPSVYLVDRQGYVRYWWYGELNWQGAAGEALMRKRIEQLLAEKE